MKKDGKRGREIFSLASSYSFFEEIAIHPQLIFSFDWKCVFENYIF